jgi:Electron transfer DM13
MKRILISLFAGGLGGIALGFALGIFIYPFWFLNDIADEKLRSGVQRTTISSGMFVQADPNDPVHYGKGQVKLYREAGGNVVVALDKDFEVGPGPRFHIYLVDHAKVRSKADFQEAKMVDLGRLRAFRGSQIYQVPQGTDVAKYQSVVIWCKEFGVLISPASLGEPKISAIKPALIKGSVQWTG